MKNKNLPAWKGTKQLYETAEVSKKNMNFILKLKQRNEILLQKTKDSEKGVCKNLLKTENHYYKSSKITKVS